MTSDVFIRVRGIVQGVGFRPFVHRTANGLGLRGWVRNDTEGVLIRAAGESLQITALTEALRDRAPAAARVAGIEERAASDGAPPLAAGFRIVGSELAGEITAAAPPDLALCAECRREMLDPSDRRHRYPFITCTQCGPRYSIIDCLPYDRPRTTMRQFALCPLCRAEYKDPSGRRFHAEPIACPACGPHLHLSGPDGQATTSGEAALGIARALLRDGGILAVKGIGGFHLMCDATSESAVAELRRRKRRDEKPLAVMFRDVEQLRNHAELDSSGERALTSASAPIVLLTRRPSSTLAASIAPGNPWVGALLPYAPLHMLLLAPGDPPVVATSANLSEEPLCTDNAEAHHRLAGIADLFLEHDRPIARPVDDSVIRITSRGDSVMLRRARGHAPAPLLLPRRLHAPLLCTGSHLKNTIAVAQGDQVVLSPHIGDLDNAAARDLSAKTAEMLLDLCRAKIGAVAHDKHPDYASTLLAQRMGVPGIPVQHHLAHVLAVLLEHNQTPDGVLGVAWDGTGYGEDGTVWGGEFIVLQGNRARRFARLRPFPLPGGDVAARDARRVALAMADTCGIVPALEARMGKFPDRDNLMTMMRRGLNSPLCTSAGRLFDAAGALLSLGSTNRFEGQLPLRVEAAATGAQTSIPVSFTVGPARTPGATLDIDWQPAFERLLRGGDAAPLALGFHLGLAAAITEVARAAGAATVALSGGCFQNLLLLERTTAALESEGFRVLTARILPPNDNAIAAGQALAALWSLTSVETGSETSDQGLETKGPRDEGTRDQGASD